MVKAICGNLLKYIEIEKLDGILNSANGVGPMGRGIAGVIKKYGGYQVQSDAFIVCNKQNPQAGDAYSTISGRLEEKGIKRIIHATTMKQPGGITSLKICEKAFKSALQLAEKENIKTLGCTALGTGVGGLDPKEIAKIMLPIAKASNINIVFVDFDQIFINEILNNLN